MNNLKFRAYIKSIQKVVDVTKIDLNNKMLTLDIATNKVCIPYWWKETELAFSQVIIMQSTGLFDKNGKEIFEGDIVIDTVGPQIKMVVKWIDDCAAFRTVGTYEGENFVGYVGHETKFGKNTCQVIGNIYENKEILG